MRNSAEGDKTPGLGKRLLSQGNAHRHRGALSDRAPHLQLARASKQSLQPPSQQVQGVKAVALCKEMLFDFRRWHTLSVITNAHLYPWPCRTDDKPQQSGVWRGAESVPHGVLDQRLK